MSVWNDQIDGNHYSSMKIQPMQYAIENRLEFTEACVVKYVSRWRNKNGIADLRKARDILDKMIYTAENDPSYCIPLRPVE